MFAYHVFLNALMEESCIDAIKIVAKHISQGEVHWETENTLKCRDKPLQEFTEYAWKSYNCDWTCTGGT